MDTKIVSPLAQQAIWIGYQEHWRFKVVGHGNLPTESYYKDEWWFIPSEIPVEAQDRIDALRKAGVNCKGCVIAHETPKLLPAPKVEEKTKPDFKVNSIVTEKAITNFVIILLEGLVFVFSMLFQLVLLDPAVIVVLEDGTWLEVMTWYE